MILPSIVLGTAVSATLSSVDVLLQVNQAHLEAISVTGTVPPMASRNLAIVHQAISSSIAEMPNSCKGRRDGQITATVYSSIAVLEKLYPTQKFDKILGFATQAVRYRNFCVDSAQSIGTRAGSELVEKRSHDGSASAEREYVPVVGKPGEWVPTAPNYAKPLYPNWGAVKPFVVKSVETYTANKTLLPLTSQEYIDSYNEVKAIGSFNSTTRTADQSHIAKYWASGPGTYTPPGQWNSIAQILIKQKPIAFERAVTILELLNIALADAGIVCWDVKYKFNFWRPITAIRQLDDPTWTPLLPTPPFPEYTSGHSSFSGAAVEVLSVFFGNNSSFTLEYFGLTRSYTSLNQALADAGMSRIYGGIHFMQGNMDGQKSGRAIAKEIMFRISNSWLVGQ
jgi:hypothetical protein